MNIARKMRNGLGSLLAAGLLLVGVGCEGSFSIDFGFLGGEASDEFPLTAAVDDVDTIRVTTDIGHIVVNFDDTLTEAEINAAVEVRASRDSVAEELLDEVDILVATLASDPGVLIVEADIPSEGIIAVDFDIVLPAGVNLELATDTGRVEVTGNDGEVVVDTNTGSVAVADNTGDVVVETDTGRVDLTDVTGSIDARTETGAITVSAVVSDDGSIDVQTRTGGIAITAPDTTNADLDLETNFGVVEVNLVGFVVTNLQTQVNSVSAVLNDGGAMIRARADVGNIEFAGY